MPINQNPQRQGLNIGAAQLQSSDANFMVGTGPIDVDQSSTVRRQAIQEVPGDFG